MTAILLKSILINNEESNISKALTRKLRRADNFTKLCVKVTQNILNQNNIINNISPESRAIILATRFGPIETNFRYLDTVFDFGEEQGSPILFSHSVHNTASGYISRIFNFKGPIYNISSYSYPLFSALLTALELLEQKLAELVLIIEAETKSDLLNQGIKDISLNNNHTEIAFFNYAIAWILIKNIKYINNEIYNILIIDNFKLIEYNNNILSSSLLEEVKITYKDTVIKTDIYHLGIKFTQNLKEIHNILAYQDNINFHIKSKIGYIDGKLYKIKKEG